MGLFDRLIGKNITPEEQRVVMHEALQNVSLDGKTADTKKLLGEVIKGYEQNTISDTAEQLPETVSLEEIVHDLDGSREIPKTLRSVGVTHDLSINKYIVNADYRVEVLDWLEKMFLTDEHLGGAVKKIVRMLSTEYTLELKYEDDEKQKNKMLRLLENVSFGDVNIYEDGTEAIETNKNAINNMAAQLVLGGAISRMIIVHKNKVVGTTPVNVKNLVPTLTQTNNIEWYQKFVNNGNFEHYIQMQHDQSNIITDTNYVVNPHRGSNYNGMESNPNLIQVDEGKYLKLTSKRFIYNAALTLQDNPTAIPPLLNAIAANKLERTMMGGVASYAERFNAVSFLTVLVKPITAKNGESRTAYAKRVNELLDKVTTKIDNGFRHGYFIGFEGVHNIEINSTQSDAVGFNTLYKWAVINKASGLGVPPLLLGVETQVSESLARILIQTMLAELKDYQDCISDSLLKFFNMYITLNYPEYAIRMKKNNTVLKITFEPSTVQDNLRAEQAKALKLNRVISMVNQGIINNDAAAKMLGYEKAFLPAPPVPVEPNKPLTKKKKDEPNTSKKPARDKINEFSEKLLADLLKKKLINTDTFWEDGHTHEVSWEHSKFSETDEKKVMFRLIAELHEAVQEICWGVNRINGRVFKNL